MNQVIAEKPATTVKIKGIAYWIFTAIIVLETAAGAQWDLARNPIVIDAFHKLGYPLYLLDIIGVWKIPGAIVLLIPGFTRVKEWAYAGVFFIYTGAAASAILSGNYSESWGPIIFAAITLVSYYLRPANRRLAPTEKADQKNKFKTISYWTTIVILGYVLISGGIGEIFHLWGTLDTSAVLGYPVYFLTILGIWKVLGGIAIIVPGFPRLKEWAYAGIFFNMTGASLSHALRADYGAYSFHIIVPLLIAALAVVSWALRPASRKL
jgi:uncharacterized membrane protein YphA (DoxX/SURF4 family)